jgi:hypothetical protein
MSNPVIIGRATLYLGDCRDVLPSLPKVDLVCTDPPYGIDIGGAGKITKATEYGKHDWDKTGLDAEQFAAIKAAGEDYIVWGANHLADIIGKHPGVLIWDKKCQNGWDDTFSDAETAACSTITRAKVCFVISGSAHSVRAARNAITRRRSRWPSCAGV